MSFIPRITCRRCGRQYSGLLSRCPYCGTRRVKQSDRVPSPTPGMNPETNAARRAGVNTKWQMIFGAVLLAAVILAVIVLVSSSLNGGILSTPSPTLPPVSSTPESTPSPTPTPPPTPTIDSIEITYYGEKATDFTMTNIGDTTQLQATIYPRDVTADIIWSAEDETIATVDETGLVTAVASGWTNIIAECYGVSTTCIVRVRG